ncbi:hypothetical protein GCK72_012116 [Caenorhabditis remanei]|uniref:Uncharacterized protein n=1 Tax=Caenorhabditis remanei TaxID=31234 RepID=A0A6A5GM01_CAERE|nr:hypothetical protein GCK72_012116 [Caenorhabditis remanei]KAF1755666.1 hypothetical protein GCK72_012116 [Caenorhabditis remanei]
MDLNQHWSLISRSERKSYLEYYPSPLGHFKTVFIVQNIHPVLENDDHALISQYFNKMNIGFSHALAIVNTRLVLSAYCRVNDPNVGKWRIKANLKFTINDYNHRDDSIIYDCGDVWFDNNINFIQRTTFLTANDILNQDFGFVRGTQMIIGTDIRILEVEGFHQPVVMNHRVPPENPENRFVFAYPNENLYCSKEIMDILCELNGDKKVSASGRIQFQIASRGPLEEFLDCLYGAPIPVHGRGGLKDFLNIADHFLVRAVTQRVATAVIHDAGVNEVNLEFLKLAVQRNMRRVVHRWLIGKQSINKEDVVDLGVHRMSGEIMKAIVLSTVPCKAFI